MRPAFSVILDLDGTMIDTAPGVVHTMNVLLERRGRRRLTLEEVRGQISYGARAIMRHAMHATGSGVGDDELGGLFDEFIEHYSTIMGKASTPYPGLQNALAGLGESGKLLGVCTNRIEQSAVTLLDELGLGGHFAAIIGQDTIGIAKPDPAPVFETLKRMGGDAEHAIFIGDSEIDIAAAKAANLPVIAVSFGYSKVPAIELGADMLIHHFDQLEAAISALMPGHKA